MNQTQKKTRSVKFAFILLLLLSAVLMASFASAGAEGGSTPISEAVFPDASFRQYVSYSFDADGNGSLSEDEIFPRIRPASTTPPRCRELRSFPISST